MSEYEGYRKYHGLVTPGLNRKVQLREYPPHRQYLIRPPAAKIEECEGLLDDRYFPMTTDGNGFINPHYGDFDRDRNVVFLGGSTTECIWNSEECRWPNLVARLYNEAAGDDRHINTLNSGVWGNTTAQSINLLYNKVLPLQPHACVLMHNINDLVLMIHEGDYWAAEIPSRKLLVRTEFDGMSLSYVFDRFLKQKLAQWRERLRFPKRKVSADDEFATVRDERSRLDLGRYRELFTANLNIFVHICQAKGIRPVLMTQAHRIIRDGDPAIRGHVEMMLSGKGLSYDEVVDYFASLNQCTREVAEQHGVLCIDLEALVPQTGEYMFDSVHFTDSGCEHVARVIADSFLAEL